MINMLLLQNLMSETLKQDQKKTNLVSKNDIVGKKNQIYMKKLATKAELKAKKDMMKKLKTYDSSLFTDQSYFIEMDHKML